jgi:hypothetical protein
MLLSCALAAVHELPLHTITKALSTTRIVEKTKLLPIMQLHVFGFDRHELLKAQ